ncbi:MAG: hypothetical protein K8S00_13635 [Bacteroidales bacterium]|nr:hypothetical protein [Bacteroidales bacterium]
MKKTVFTILIMVFAVVLVNSQDMKSKKGVPILPEKGDYCIGVDAAPLFGYLGNMFNANINNQAPAFNFTATTPMTIFVKHMIDDETASRAMFRIGFASASLKNMIVDDVALVADPTSTVQVEDKWGHSEMFILLGYGLEKRRGKGRVQGIYGAEGFLLFMNYSDKYTWGNEITTTNNAPTTTGWDEFGGWNWANIVNPPDWATASAGQRTNKTTSGTTIGIGARAFCGVEYFFAPKMSIGGEFGWSLAFLTTGNGKTTTENWDMDSNTVKETEQETGGNSVFSIDIDNLPSNYNLTSPVLAGPQGSISLFFYF